MEDAVEKYGFGAVVRLDDPAGFAASVRALLNMDANERKRAAEGALNYAQSMDARRYMSQFLTEAEL
jgi:trehalose-6-phosphate synthase